MSDLMKIHPVGAELFVRTDRRVAKLIFAFRFFFAKASNK